MEALKKRLSQLVSTFDPRKLTDEVHPAHHAPHASGTEMTVFRSGGKKRSRRVKKSRRVKSKKSKKSKSRRSKSRRSKSRSSRRRH